MRTKDSIMTFASEEEMWESGQQILEYHQVSYGVRAIIRRDIFNDIDTEKGQQKERMYYITAFCNGGLLYCGKKGPTYNKCLAKTFPKSMAVKKATMMSKNGTYQWKVV